MNWMNQRTMLKRDLKGNFQARGFASEVGKATAWHLGKSPTTDGVRRAPRISNTFETIGKTHGGIN
jgi:hypothetical protein